jgi:hypothetical protein
MSATNGRPPYRHSKAALPKPGDEQATYTHAQLIRMDNQFRARLVCAFKRCEESRASAAQARASAAQAYVIPSRSLTELLAFPAPLW